MSSKYSYFRGAYGLYDEEAIRKLLIDLEKGNIFSVKTFRLMNRKDYQKVSWTGFYYYDDNYHHFKITNDERRILVRRIKDYQVQYGKNLVDILLASDPVNKK